MLVKDLIGKQLDEAVVAIEIAEGRITDKPLVLGKPYYRDGFLFGEGREQTGTISKETGFPWVFHGAGCNYSPSLDWEIAGEILEKEKITLDRHDDGRWLAEMWTDDGMNSTGMEGETPLVAICRVYVYSRFGDEIEME